MPVTSTMEESSLSPEECRRIAERLDQCCRSKSISLRLVTERFADVPPEAARRSDFLTVACSNEYVGPDVIRFLVERHPEKLRGAGGGLPLHAAMTNRSMSDRVKLEVVRVLVEARPDFVREGFANVPGRPLPIHVASESGTLGMVEYLFSLYPEGIRLPNRDGWHPIHLAASRRGGDKGAVVDFILRHDPGGAARVRSGMSPLQMACGRRCPECPRAVLALSDAHPEAIFPYVRDGTSLAAVCRRLGYYSWTAGFLATLATYARLSEDREALARRDSDGRTLLHRALHARASLGAVKLLVRAHTDALRVADAQGNFPLHLACRAGAIEVASYLLDEDASPVAERNADGELPVRLLCESAEREDEGEGGAGRVEVVWRMLLACPDVIEVIWNNVDTAPSLPGLNPRTQQR